MMLNGLYALASLDGRPVAPADLAVLGLDEGAKAAGCTLLPRDVRASAVHSRVHNEGADALIGDLDEPEELARSLGLPESSDPLTLALAAFDRFGDRAPRQMLGSWLLARWHSPSATMTLLMAERVRDTCYIAVAPGRLAIAPDLARLARLDWVDAEPDPRNFLLKLGNAAMRRGIGDGTMLRHVHRVLPGTRVTIADGGVRTSVAEPDFAPETARDLSFDDALAEIDAILRRIMRQHFARHGDAAFLLSGGLDSSLLGLIGALERGDRRMTFLTSAAPPGSGLADETEYATQVADHLGVPMQPIVPPATANVYLPQPGAFAVAQGPLLSPRHYLDEALQDAATALGATILIDGSAGEMSVTNHAYFFDPPPRATPLRDAARALRNRWRGVADRWPHNAFHVRLSRRALADVPADFAELYARGEAPNPQLRPDDPIGVAFGVGKMAVVPSTTVDPRMRQIPLFLDRRLIYAVASMPAKFTRHGGEQRAIARFLMQGRLPDSIAFRPTKMPFSPNYIAMIGEQTDTVAARLPLYRAADIGDWLDLDWLATALTRMKNAPDAHNGIVPELQMTAIAAEFLLWWREQV